MPLRSTTDTIFSSAGRKSLIDTRANGVAQNQVPHYISLSRGVRHWVTTGPGSPRETGSGGRKKVDSCGKILASECKYESSKLKGPTRTKNLL